MRLGRTGCLSEDLVPSQGMGLIHLGFRRPCQLQIQQIWSRFVTPYILSFAHLLHAAHCNDLSVHIGGRFLKGFSFIHRGARTKQHPSLFDNKYPSAINAMSFASLKPLISFSTVFTLKYIQSGPAILVTQCLRLQVLGQHTTVPVQR